MTHMDYAPRIKVIGIGGGGTNAVDAMTGANLHRVEFVVADTGPRQLIHTRAAHRIRLAPDIVQGPGVKPDVGDAAAGEIRRCLDGAHMVFIVAGMGGNAGTGVAPVIARMAKDCGILTVGVVTTPFGFEGARRAQVAQDGIAGVQQCADMLIVIPNDKLLLKASAPVAEHDAFKMADGAIHSGISRIAGLLFRRQKIGIDFAGVRAVITNMGKAAIGTGEAAGENRAIQAAELAMADPLLGDADFSDASGLLITVTGGEDSTLFEVDRAATRIRREFGDKVHVIFGWLRDKSMEGRLSVAIVVVGRRNFSASVTPMPCIPN